MKKLLLLSALLIFACSSDDSTSDDNSQPSNCDVVYLDDNGITIKACDDAIVGQSGIVNGISYIIVSGVMLNNLIENGDDLTRVCTTRIVNMEDLNFDNNFNQDIGNWDVSSVTDMDYMFLDDSAFNQDIGNWDVSSVTDMTYMFGYSSAFNQDIGNWDVDNVTQCSSFSTNTPQWTLPQPNFTNCNPN